MWHAQHCPAVSPEDDQEGTARPARSSAGWNYSKTATRYESRRDWAHSGERHSPPTCTNRMTTNQAEPLESDWGSKSCERPVDHLLTADRFRPLISERGRRFP